MPTLKGVYGITPAESPSSTETLEKIEQALRGGLSILQFRHKSHALNQAPQKTLLKQALAFQDLCKQYHCLFIINDNATLAKQINADGLHLGQQDMPLNQAREMLGPKACIGITCHNSLALAQQAQALGADYVAFGSFYPSQTKPNASKADISTLNQAKQTLNLPIVAIGGITLHNAAPLIHSGADMIAVVQSLFSTGDVETRCTQFNQLFSNT